MADPSSAPREPRPIIGATWHAHDAPLGICDACGRSVEVQLGADGGVIVPAGYCGHCSVTTVWDRVDVSDATSAPCAYYQGCGEDRKSCGYCSTHCLCGVER